MSVFSVNETFTFHSHSHSHYEIWLTLTFFFTLKPASFTYFHTPFTLTFYIPFVLFVLFVIISAGSKGEGATGTNTGGNPFGGGGGSEEDLMKHFSVSERE